MPTSQQDQAARDLVQKLRLEMVFRREVRSIFSRMVKDFTVVAGRTGFPSSAERYKPDWESALKRHYERTQRAFRGMVIEQQKNNPSWHEKKQDEDENEKRDKEALLLLALLTWKEEHAETSAAAIVSTSQQNYRDALRQAREISAEEGKPQDNRSIALLAATILKRKFSGREPGILMFETQQASESTKLAEAVVESGIQPSILTGITAVVTEAIKTWWTVGDNKVRLFHQQANRQKKKVNEPFIVGGQMLMHPGDTSLGATMDNVANCRCSALYSL